MMNYSTTKLAARSTHSNDMADDTIDDMRKTKWQKNNV